MIFTVWFWRTTAAVLLSLSLNGCQPASQSQMEEEKESHFMAGKNCISGLDYPGAIEEFQRALEVNPRSASAHFQLGILHEEKEPDSASAIYHYEQYLKLRPSADNAEVIRQHITNCKQDLAKSVLPLPVTPAMQRDFERLAEENKQLRAEIEQWKAYSANLHNSSNPPTRAVVAPLAPARTAAPAPVSPPQTNPIGIGQTAPHPLPRNGTGRSYIVKQGETLAAIARKNGLKLESLQAANPGLAARRLKVGQTIILPKP
jgi:LysM repeat protein